MATSTISQTVNLSTAATKIDTGTTPYTLSGLLGGYLLDPSAASVQVTFLSAGGAVLGTGSIGPVIPLDRLGVTGFQQQDVSGTIPAGTRSAVVTATFDDRNPVLGNYNDAYADNLSFTVGDPTLTAAPLTAPTSHVGSLDHVFVIYMENKGVGDIVGSPNAPYINSLINTYGYADNYYSLGHPSNAQLLPDPGRIGLRHRLQPHRERHQRTQPHARTGSDVSDGHSVGRLRAGHARPG